ncbi:MAG: carboxylating nicotinate-nucleotide diphosphorylase [Planctomycetes bacterium]|nr:carboxylating nicotinate-nucleotide diphosphorylase [Planctomycetota bacterium]
MMSEESEFRAVVKAALFEDRAKNDLTSGFLVPADLQMELRLIAEEDAVVCGLPVVKIVFEELDAYSKCRFDVIEGAEVKADDVVATIGGRARALLSGERTALNFLSLMSGCATNARAVIREVIDLGVTVLDTRKTTPLLRSIEKYAVRAGGATNHRMHLADAVMLKDNHFLATSKAGVSFRETLERAVKEFSGDKEIVCEVDSIAQLSSVIDLPADVFLLDNFSALDLRAAVKLRDARKSSSLLESSGGVTIENIRDVALAGVDRISLGALTSAYRRISFKAEFQ